MIRSINEQLRDQTAERRRMEGAEALPETTLSRPLSTSTALRQAAELDWL